MAQAVEIENAVRSVQAFQQRVDVLVNNAGIKLDKLTESVTADDWDLILNVNLRGAFLLAKELLPLFSSSGASIVNISSIHATRAFPNSVAYACSKAAMVALTRNLALDLASRHIRVNCICPGYIDTRIWEQALEASNYPDEIASKTAALHPVGRRGVPHDIAEAALFFASEDSAFITGTDLVVDGGLTVRAHP
ncbi:MAG TPA: SDR family oxidoreductase [Candidatus Sulfotelmatobacter sp.]|nr:SDR family oxidoreductase [Candidatus Sulfotelmatobacter sp.]